MGGRALLLVKGLPLPKHHFFTDFSCNSSSAKLLRLRRNDNGWGRRNFSTWATNGSSLEPPDVPRLAETARISLAPHEVEEFAPKIRQVIDWFGQLQAVDLQSVEPAIRADTQGDNFRDDVPETFENREAIIAAVPNYEELYVKVPKILNKE